MKVILGDNIEILKQYPDNYFDAVVTDPPYGLGKEPNAVELMKDWVESGYHEIKGRGFMGKEWDAFVPQPIFWKEVYRVLKHGGHVVSFFGTRTYDWGVMAMRFAGFEIRNFVSWSYGSGFPKALDISKSIDKMNGAEREIIGTNGTKPIQTSGRINSEASATGKFEREENYITAPSTDLAKKWDGWKTDLKPAHEPIVLARKPIEKGLTITENVIKYGTGALNIDGFRISTKENINGGAYSKNKTNDGNWGTMHNYVGKEYEQPSGRFPSNFILTHSPECKPLNNEIWECVDGCPIKNIDEQSGLLKSGAMKKSYEYQNNGFSLGKPTGATKQIHEANEGGASRFFLNTSFEESDFDIFRYVAKASKSEKNKGIENQNIHATVKPIEIMRYLVKLVTPPNGIVLEPFMGSGTTGIACKMELFDFVGIEKEEEYFNIAKARIENYTERVNIKFEEPNKEQLSLF